MTKTSSGTALGAATILLILLLHLANIEALRPRGYRLPQSMGRSAAAASDVGSGRDLFKKFMLWRGLFPTEPPRDNIIVIPPQRPTFGTFTTTPTTTTTTTTIVNGTNTRRWRNLEDQPQPQSLEQQKRITKRSRPRGTYGKRGRPKKSTKKKKTRHRHIHKRQQQQQRRRH